MGLVFSTKTESSAEKRGGQLFFEKREGCEAWIMGCWALDRFRDIENIILEILALNFVRNLVILNPYLIFWEERNDLSEWKSRGAFMITRYCTR